MAHLTLEEIFGLMQKELDLCEEESTSIRAFMVKGKGRQTKQYTMQRKYEHCPKGNSNLESKGCFVCGKSGQFNKDCWPV
jgi:hypothetical protein